MSEFARLSRDAAAEGIVLLKNEDGMLPLKQGEKAAVFGRCQIDYYRNGTGSGGEVNVAHTINLQEGIREQQVFSMDEELACIYTDWVSKNPFDTGGGGWAAEPWHQKEMEVPEELFGSCAARNDKALVIIGRTAGEDQDNGDVEGSLRLTAEERRLLKGVCRHFERVAVLLNVSNIIDMKWMDDPEIAPSLKAVCYLWQGAMEGGAAAAAILSGEVNPSGKLTDTIAYELCDYPSTANYGGTSCNYYQEDIYVGYRYFETFAPERVKYPFGYGMSYSRFEMGQKAGYYDEKEKEIIIWAWVKNLGPYAGKETVQIYAQAPQGKLGKPARVLAGFAKTKRLEIGESQDLEIRIPLQRFASYDDSGVTGQKSSWVLEQGDYVFYIGTDCRACNVVRIGRDTCWHVEELMALEKLEEAMAPVRPFSRMRTDGEVSNGIYRIGWENVPVRTIDLKERIEKNLPEEIPYTGKMGIRLQDVGKTAKMEQFIAQFDERQLAVLVRGEGMSSPKVTSGTAAAFGGVSDDLLDSGVPIACAADGPSGIRMIGGKAVTQLPIGTLLAATWNTELVKQLYEMEGREMEENRIDTLLGPGMNIRRSPLNGRNFEYYSEDPLVTGLMAAAATEGIRRGGGQATIKHFCCNNQEKERSAVDAVVSERALREIYLKGFEIAIKEGGAKSVMSSYNPTNGYWTASNYDLLTTILRKQWGFQGIVMTDWWAKMNDVVDGGEGSMTRTGDMVRAQNDLYMVVSNNGAEVNAAGDDTEEALRCGKLTFAELQRSAGNIFRFLMEIPAFRRSENIHAAEKAVAAGTADEPCEYLEKELELRLDAEKEIWIHTEEEGSFDLFANCMCPGNNQMQTANCLQMNGEDVCIIQTNGTDGRWIRQKLTRVKLQKGDYRVGLKTLKPGLCVEWLRFIRR